MKKCFLLLTLLTHFVQMECNQYPLTYEGVALFSNTSIDLTILPQFLPYNPVIVEAGAYVGTDVCKAATIWPKSKIFAFEPNPNAFIQLQKNITDSKAKNIKIYNLALNNHNGISQFYMCHGTYGKDAAYEFASSLLKPSKEMEIHYQGPIIEVPCVVLDQWCLDNNIDHIDLLKLELEGNELQVLMSSPNVLKNLKVLQVQTAFFPFRIGTTNYYDLKAFLESSGFVLLSHWYHRGLSGTAVFLSREIFDAYFKLSLGIYLGS